MRILSFLRSMIGVAALIMGGCGDNGGKENPLGADNGEPPSDFQTIALADTNLEAAIRVTLDKSTGAISAAEVLSLTKLEARGRSIAELGGIEHLHHLEILDLADNRLENLSPLASLGQLTFLDLSGNKIRDISPLAGLEKLQILALDNNAVEDLAVLLELPALASVELTGNPLGGTGWENHLTALRDRGVEVGIVEIADAPEAIAQETPSPTFAAPGRIAEYFRSSIPSVPGGRRRIGADRPPAKQGGRDMARPARDLASVGFAKHLKLPSINVD